MRLKKTLSAVIAAAMLSSVLGTAGAVTAGAAAAPTVDGIDPADYSSYTTYDGELGALYTPEATTFKVWAPTSTDVKLRLYSKGSDAEDGAALLDQYQMELDKSTGVWSVKVSGDIKNQYYTYFVTNAESPKGVEVEDIYAKAAGVNGNRGMVVDLDSTDPTGWENDTYKLVNSPTEAEVWEIHVKDFSYDPESGVSEQYRGKYMAFTELETTLNNAGDVKTCMNYLKDLGVNYVQINPMYDYGSVDEASGDDTQFNWGYDPKNYNVPEGSYSTNPYDGNVRIKEMKTMIQTLHENGIGVIMDVVYNHTYLSKNSWFNYTVPGYYYRQNADGSWSNGSSCGNDTASEREMFKKYMVDSVTYWAEEYHIDGFRFDLMGLHDCDTMNAVRESLDNIDNRILTYGEGWVMTTTTDKKNWAGNKTSLCIQAKAKKISDRIGFFDDDIRDALKGKAYNDLVSAGYVSGNTGFSKTIYNSTIGHTTATNWKTALPGQEVAYSCCHDNQTLWDRLVATQYGSTADDKYYDMRNEKFVSGNKLSGAIVMTSQGVSFMLAGEEFARTKYGDHNSYRSSPNINMIDWSRTVDYADIVSYYKGLIQLKNTYPAYKDATANTSAATERLETPGDVIGYRLPNLVDTSGKSWSNLVVYFNGSLTDPAEVELPQIGEPAPTDTDVQIGDLDGDGDLTASDALIILRASAGLTELSDAEMKLADYNSDGDITSEDALAVLRFSAGLTTNPPSRSSSTVYSVIVNKQTAGIAEIETVSGKVTIEPNSALVLVPKAEYDKADVGEKYYQNEGTVVVSHIDESTGETLFKTTLRGPEGQSYSTAAASDLSLEYDFQRVEGDAQGKIEKGTKEVKYYYAPYPGGVGTVIVKYVDENNKALAESVTTRARAGETYTSKELGFPWYKLVSKPENAQGIYTGDTIEVIYKYQSTDEVVESTIHVQLADGTKFTPYLHVWNIYDETNGSKKHGTNWPGVLLEDGDGDGWYEYTFLNGNGYNWILNDNNGSQTADMSSAGDIWVVANGAAAKVTVYDHNPDKGDPSDTDSVKGTLVVKHVDETGADIVAPKETERPVGTDYKATALDSKWYTVDETQLPANAEGKYTEGTVEVVFHYNKVPTKMTTVHVKLTEDAKFDPYLYFWEAKDETSWPGVKMTDEDKDGWYEYTIETGESYNWILNDGKGGQSDDMSATGDIYIIATSPTNFTVHDLNPDKV